jgi:hypothetical protein
LGYFVIHLGGKMFGVRSSDATLLACSFDTVQRRLARRGTHSVALRGEPDAAGIADAFRSAVYDASRQDECFFGMTSVEFQDALAASEIVWVPDGDEAFDDGGHVLQFDQGDRVRLIAFRNDPNPEKFARSIVDRSLGADEFYGVLDEWQRRFEAEWAIAAKSDPESKQLGP